MGPFNDGEFIADDIQALVSYEYRKRVEPVIGALQDIFGTLEHYTRYDLIVCYLKHSLIILCVTGKT